MTPPPLRVENVEIRRGRRTVIRGFTGELRPGRIWWVVGENGIGKSSFLRALAGRLRPRRGRLRLGSRDLLAGDAAYYHPAMSLPAGGRLDDLFRLGRSLGAPIERDGLLSWELEGRQRLESLSTGQAKRLLLALVLRSEAPVLLLDEPFDHLSAAGRAALLDRLRLRALRRLVVLGTNLGLPAGERAPRVIDFDALGEAHP